MLKEFIEHIQQTTQPQITEVEGRTFAVSADGKYSELRPELDHPDSLGLHSLDALVKLVKTEAVHAEHPLYIAAPDHMTVECFGSPRADERFRRQFYYTARATNVPGWDEKVTLPFEEMQIALRTADNDEAVRYPPLRAKPRRNDLAVEAVVESIQQREGAAAEESDSTAIDSFLRAVRPAKEDVEALYAEEED